MSTEAKQPTDAEAIRVMDKAEQALNESLALIHELREQLKQGSPPPSSAMIFDEVSVEDALRLEGEAFHKWVAGDYGIPINIFTLAYAYQQGWETGRIIEREG